jgi:beta-N-acetylhexosaminidase
MKVAKMILPLLFPLMSLAQAPDFLNWQQDKRCMTWVDSVYAQMDTNTRIGQFFMIAAYTGGEKYNMDTVLRLVSDGRAGGVLFFKGNPTAQVAWTNKIQAAAKVKTFIAIDGEWGPAMRLDSVVSFPKQQTLGAIRNNELLYQMGAAIGKQCKRLGININFAPCVDVNNNPLNPVINDRSFGEDKFNVSLKGLEYAQGMQDQGILACAKHFPGHGDVSIDSHYDLPLIPKSYEELKKLELYPFQVLFSNGVGSVMIAHLSIPALDTTKNLPSTLSPAITTALLRDSLKYNGLVFTDAMNMKGLTKYFSAGVADSMAFFAGNDVLEFSENCILGAEKIKAALINGTISDSVLERRVKKVLAYKYMVGLNNFQPIPTANLYQDLNSDSLQLTRNKLYEKAVTLVANADGLIPLRTKPNARVASLTIGSKSKSTFQANFEQLIEADMFLASNDSNGFYDTLLQYDVIVVDVHCTSRLPAKKYGITQANTDLVNRLSKTNKVILIIFGNPYSFSYFTDVRTAIAGYEDNDFSQNAAANLLLGGIVNDARLPVTASAQFPFGTSIKNEELTRIKLSSPVEAGIGAHYMQDIDDAILNGLMANAFPGCQLTVIHENKVFLNKAYGSRTYDDPAQIDNTSLLDVASLTKVLSTTLACMKLYDEKKLNLTKTVDEYLDLPEDASIGKITVRNLLLHQSGMKPFIEFYKTTTEGGNRDKYYRKIPEGDFTIPVADSMFMRKDYRDSMWNLIAHVEVDPKPKYIYSDLNFYILQRIAEKISGKPLDEYVRTTFYEPMGLTRLGYKPLERFRRERILPTEMDTAFRKQTVLGFVHDPGAAMMGGVAGHAGIFSNSMDVAVIFQMLLNDGRYNGVKFVDSATVAMFTKRLSSISRRALGFDKPEADAGKASPCSENTPPSAFGHQGFTGTCAWADPTTNTVFVFLSNRVYPTASNTRLAKMNLRTKLQQIVYRAVKKQ